MSPSKAQVGPEIKCRCCGGTGKIRLPVGQWRVYSLVQQGYQTASEIFQQIEGQEDIEQKAVSMRLKALFDAGLLIRHDQKRGRQWVYGLAAKEGE